MASYQQLGRYYDLIYSWKNYAREAAEIYALAKRFRQSKGLDLLDLGCGTGEHIKALAKYYRCTGLDLNSEMLKVARKKTAQGKICSRQYGHVSLEGSVRCCCQLV